MKVLVLTREYPPHIYGGAGVHVEHLTRELAHLVDVEVRCFGPNEQAATPGQPAVRGFEVDERSCEGLDSRLRKAIEPLAIDVRMVSQAVDADVVHCHTWYTLMAGLWAKKLYGIPFVVTIHSLEPLRPWKEEQLGRGYHLSSWIERTAIREADVVVAVSAATRSDVIGCYDLDPEKVRVIHNGIDLERFRPTAATGALEKYGISRERPYVLFVGRATRQKGVLHLAQALEQVTPDLQAVFCAGEPDTEDVAREMEQAVQRLQARRSGVYWIREMVPVDELIELYSAALLFVCPSVYEPFGIINLEAMACGIPVVANRVGGIPEVVVDGETGILVPTDGRSPGFDGRSADAFASDLASAINRLAEDTEACKRMGEAGRRRVEEHFSWEAIARQTLELYEELVVRQKVRS